VVAQELAEYKSASRQVGSVSELVREHRALLFAQS
jgi:hypothetical protein